MFAVARCWVNYNGVWHRAGERFEFDEKYAGEIAKVCDVVESEKQEKVDELDSYVSEIFPPDPVSEKPKRNKKKTAKE